ncbi:unnamed protein product [Darwinula stevensoni]|uniref:Uncharacterized protein n=1 Tax=Darwinula stevensoni TaxID=69355 RepID=A0A7R9ACV6_9CRUS|nr:unnamed protein product [Darwinula stevensoni]CAG0900531.1 unnamed protein product [Darwinula stevensoni]
MYRTGAGAACDMFGMIPSRQFPGLCETMGVDYRACTQGAPAAPAAPQPAPQANPEENNAIEPMQPDDFLRFMDLMRMLQRRRFNG